MSSHLRQRVFKFGHRIISAMGSIDPKRTGVVSTAAFKQAIKRIDFNPVLDRDERRQVVHTADPTLTGSVNYPAFMRAVEDELRAGEIKCVFQQRGGAPLEAEPEDPKTEEELAASLARRDAAKRLSRPTVARLYDTWLSRKGTLAGIFRDLDDSKDG